MTALEFDFIDRALAALKKGDHSWDNQIKMMRTISEITAAAALKLEQDRELHNVEIMNHG